ncbi:MAG: DNA pilot protein [Arizlama microvirus]|nr:MAG: DNA pilot protein [Arizlama microvirus]
MDIAAIGSLLAGVGSAAGGAAGLFRSGGSSSGGVTPQMAQNWRNDDMAWSREQFDRNEALQREFAANGIRWRVADAKAAGLHPLAALGSSGSSFSPITVGGGGSYSVDRQYDRGSDIGASLSNMGQGIGRAMAATQTKAEKVATAFELARQQQELTRGDLENQILASRLAVAQQGSGPGMPSTLSTRAMPDPRPGHTETTEPLGTGYRDPYGGTTTLPQKDVNIDEVSSPGWGSFMYTNRILPFIHYVTGSKDQPTRPPDSQLPPGATSWHFAFPGRWIPSYPSYSNSGHYPSWQHYTGSRASTYRMSPSGAER